MRRPNLFDFATSELSQDAFLCWLAALADHDDGDLQRVGRSFIAWLWFHATGAAVDPGDVRLVEPPKQQWMKIDVTLEVEVAGTRGRIIIEDKTDTSHHGGQLERYRQIAISDGVKTVPIYFKTGYHFGADQAASKAGYTVIGLGEWVDFLASQTVRNDILDDYRAYVTELKRHRDEALFLLSSNAGFKEFKHAFVQHEFLGTLASLCPEMVGGSVLHRGTNMGGTPWTHYRFLRFPAALPGGVDEVIFHRIDKRQNEGGAPNYYLSTRQYAPVKGNPVAAAAKVERLNDYRAAFRGSTHESAIQFGKPAGDLRGANESEVGILFFDEGGNSTSKVLKLFPAVHRAFVERLRLIRGLPASDATIDGSPE